MYSGLTHTPASMCFFRTTVSECDCYTKLIGLCRKYYYWEWEVLHLKQESPILATKIAAFPKIFQVFFVKLTTLFDLFFNFPILFRHLGKIIPIPKWLIYRHIVYGLLKIVQWSTQLYQLRVAITFVHNTMRKNQFKFVVCHKIAFRSIIKIYSQASVINVDNALQCGEFCRIEVILRLNHTRLIL